MHENKKIIHPVIVILCFLFAFTAGISAGALFAGLLFNRQESGAVGNLNRFYAVEYGRAAETIRILTTELERERNLNRELHDNNNQARVITGGLANTTERNVRNLQEAVSLIGEIRTKIKVLEDFYTDSGAGFGAN